MMLVPAMEKRTLRQTSASWVIKEVTGGQVTPVRRGGMQNSRNGKEQEFPRIVQAGPRRAGEGKKADGSCSPPPPTGENRWVFQTQRGEGCGIPEVC